MCNICTLQQVEKKYNYAIIHIFAFRYNRKKKKSLEDANPWRMI